MHITRNQSRSAAARSARLQFALIVVFLHLTPEVEAKTSRPPVAGRRAVVVDDRLSALRARPDLTGDLIQRLRNGRVVGILREVRTKGGYRFYRVAVTRRTSGWVLADAVVRTGSQLDAERLLQFIGQEKDGFAKVRLASIFVTEMRRTRRDGAISQPTATRRAPASPPTRGGP